VKSNEDLRTLGSWATLLDGYDQRKVQEFRSKIPTVQDGQRRCGITQEKVKAWL
jgi:hypothetical protein